VQHFAGKAVGTRPLRNARGVLVSNSDDHLPRIDAAGRGFQLPTVPMPVDARDFGAQSQFDPAFPGVPVEVKDDVVTGREHSRSVGVWPVREM
jgi:hypothetical protein